MDNIKNEMKKLNGEIAELEAKRSGEEDETKQAVLQEMIDGKTADFAKAEKQLADEMAKAKREKAIADLEAKEAEGKELAGKTGALTDDGAKSVHNAGKEEMDQTDFHVGYMTCEKVADFCGKVAREKGERFLESMKSSRHAEGFVPPKWMREYILPQSTASQELGKVYGDIEKLYGKDALVREASGTNDGGGSTVASVFEPTLYKLPQRNANLAQRCWVKRAVGKDAEYPNLTQSTNRWGVSATWGNAGAASGEGSAITESNPVFTQVSVDTERLALLSQASKRYVESNDIGYAAELAWMYNGAANQNIDQAILAGVAGVTNAPTGINTNASIAAGVTLQARQTAAQVSYTDLNNLMFNVADGVMDEGMFILSAGSTGSMKYIAGLDDASGRPVFRPEDTWGQGSPGLIAGRQYISTLNNVRNDGTTIALGGRGDAIYGDFRQYALVIGKPDTMSIERSDEYAFNTGLVTYRMIMYVGGQPLGYSAFSVLGDVSGVSSSSSSS